MADIRNTKQSAQVLQTVTDGQVRSTKQAAQVLHTFQTTAEIRLTKVAVQVLKLETGPTHTAGGMQKVPGLAF